MQQPAHNTCGIMQHPHRTAPLCAAVLQGAPNWFNMLYRLIRPQLSPSTRAKVQVCTRGHSKVDRAGLQVQAAKRPHVAITATVCHANHSLGCQPWFCACMRAVWQFFTAAQQSSLSGMAD